MKTFVVTLMVVVVVIFALGSVGVAFAQSPTKTQGTSLDSGLTDGRGPRTGSGGVNTIAGEGILHDNIIADYAEKLNIPVAVLEARLDSDETMAQIAFSQGLTFDEFRTLMVDVRTQAINQAVADGTLTHEQAEWMMTRDGGQMARGQMSNGRGMRGSGQGQYTNLDCPYYNQTNP